MSTRHYFLREFYAARYIQLHLYFKTPCYFFSEYIWRDLNEKCTGVTSVIGY